MTVDEAIQSLGLPGVSRRPICSLLRSAHPIPGVGSCVMGVAEAGTEALRVWAKEVDEPTPPREAVVVRRRAAAAIGDLAAIRAVFAHHLEVHQQTYATYREIEERDFSMVDSEAVILKHLVLKGGLSAAKVQVDWCLEVIETFDRLQARASAHVQDRGVDPA